MSSYRACHCCGKIHRLPALAPRERAFCVRCGVAFTRAGAGVRASARTAAAATGALVLFWPAILLPVLEVERLGHHSSSSILGGIVDLLGEGSWFVGGVILFFSILFPLLKLALLLDLSLVGLLARRHRALTYRVMEHAGKWSMLDVLLLALLVMLVKVGDLVSFSFGLGVVAFVLCVATSIVASLAFDHHSIWERER